MSYLIKPDNYTALLDLKQTELGIKQIKDFFTFSDFFFLELLIHFSRINIKDFELYTRIFINASNTQQRQWMQNIIFIIKFYLWLLYNKTEYLSKNSIMFLQWNILFIYSYVYFILIYNYLIETNILNLDYFFS